MTLFSIFNKTNRDEIIEDIKNGDFYIQRVKYSPDYMSEDNGVDSNKDTPEYIYRIYKKIGDYWEIDLGTITDPSKIADDTIKNKLNSANVNQEFRLDKSKMNIQFAKAKIKPATIFNYENNSISKFINKNPWANLSKTIWVANKEGAKSGNVQIGYPFVLYSSDLFINPDQFKAMFEKKIAGEDNNITPLRASLHGNNFEGYMSQWGKLYHKQKGTNVIKFKSFSGYYQPILLYKQIYRFETYLNAKKDNQNTEEALKQLYSNTEITNNKLLADLAHYNEITENLSEKDLDKIISDIRTLKNNWDDYMSRLRGFGID